MEGWGGVSLFFGRISYQLLLHSLKGSFTIGEAFILSHIFSIFFPELLHILVDIPYTNQMNFSNEFIVTAGVIIGCLFCCLITSPITFYLKNLENTKGGNTKHVFFVILLYFVLFFGVFSIDFAVHRVIGHEPFFWFAFLSLILLLFI